MASNDTQHIVSQGTGGRRPPRRKVVDLSFEEHTSFGEWIYKSAISIIVVLVTVVVFGLIMIFTNIDVEIPTPKVDVVIELVAEEDIPTLEELEALKQEKERLEEEIRQELQQNVRNLQSNEAAQDEGGSESEVFDEETKALMSHVDGLLNTPKHAGGPQTPDHSGTGGEGEGSGQGKGDGKGNNFKGRVTVEYKFVDPARSARGQLYAPAYRAEHSGIVVVEVYIDRNGEVKRTKIIQSSGNKTLDDEALRAAKHKRTIFNIDDTAPQMHRGTITYTFIAQ